jgi:hypothetical protein
MKASLLSMLAKLAFAFEGGAVAVPGSTIRGTTTKTIVLNTMIWNSILNCLRFWKEWIAKPIGGSCLTPAISQRGAVITRVSS